MMGMLDKIMDALPDGVDMNSVAEKIGMTTEELKSGGEALFEKLKDDSVDKATAIKEAAAEAEESD